MLQVDLGDFLGISEKCRPRREGKVITPSKINISHCEKL